MERHCLFIDDDIEEFEDSVISRLPSIAKKSKGIDVTYEILDPTEKKYKDDNNNIDISKIEEDFILRISHKKYDLIACDYNLGDDVYFGTDIIKKYRQRDRKFIAVIYSADLKEIARQIIKLHNPEEIDSTLSKITGLVTSNISRFFVKNNNLMDDLTPLLYNTPLEKHIEQTLVNYQNLLLSHGFNSAIGMTFKEIANHIKLDTDQGKRFSEEVVERGITHLIDLNK
jgi:hypothetical protein